jgi:hypothetical protein
VVYLGGGATLNPKPNVVSFFLPRPQELDPGFHVKTHPVHFFPFFWFWFFYWFSHGQEPYNWFSAWFSQKM